MTSDEILSFLGYSTRVTYEDIKNIDRNILNKFIRETSDSYRIEVIFDAVLGHNDQITMTGIGEERRRCGWGRSVRR